MLVLGAAFAAVVTVTTPWSPLPGPVPGGRVSPDAAIDFSTAQIAREHAFHAAVHPPAYLSLGLGLAVAAVLAFTPLGARLVAAAARPLGGGWGWRVVLGTVAVLVVARLVTVPFDAWAEAVDRRYGLSTQSWGAWGLDQLRGLGVSVGVTALALLVGYALVRRFPRWWWAPVAALTAALVVGGSFAYPLVIEPVFNSFHPLPAGPLRTSIMALAQRDGVQVSDVLVADASRRTTATNAYVSGFGSSRRVVLYDTLLREPPGQIRLVVAHELGHAKRNDVLHGTIDGALGAAAAVCLLFLLLSARGLLRRAGVERLGDARSLALVLGVVTLLSFAVSPLQYLISRHIEARADVHSLDLTHDPTTFVQAQRQLALTNLSTLDPGPVIYVMFFDHPSTAQRIAMARDWARQHGVAVPPPSVASSVGTGG